MTTPNNRVSMLAAPGRPHCEKCAFYKAATDRNGGWCINADNRVYSEGWPFGFTPSVSWDGSCDLHKEKT